MLSTLELVQYDWGNGKEEGFSLPCIFPIFSIFKNIHIITWTKKDF